MKLTVRIFRRRLIFKLPAATSRGLYHEHLAHYVLLRRKDAPEIFGIGECSPLPGLSCDFFVDYETILAEQSHRLEETSRLDKESLRPYPSMLFGLETALRHLEQGSLKLWDSPFSRGERGLAINGLIWMGDFGFLREQIEAKLGQGFSCLKLKIGALDFNREIALLASIRRRFSVDKIILRVDANGAFTPREALDKLKRLTELQLHSIEQPIRAGQWAEMARLVSQSPLPIALDEELIGLHTPAAKKEMLERIRPDFLVLKPTLHGGFSGVEEWTDLAQQLGLGWWATSALESNLGLNAVAQWSAAHADEKPQGLGTGGLYINNLACPLVVRGERLWFDLAGPTPVETDLAE
ncbi:MAG: o-succinylbenzoate synthase [Candidatus Adiutrix intracellularis]|jgi:o-succinylbenzoate synthase|nr:MAG: o-succinylbenzoate synthase [Candidatus Adiutrix intracellularis]MDR2826479.1 o-succinylbenzoate synthase [Candidatus Adiutrix intracellularis]